MVPWWARGGWGILVHFGPTVLICLFLVGVLVGLVPSPLLRIPDIEREVSEIKKEHEDMKVHQATQSAEQASQSARLAALGLQSDMQTRLLRAICRNTAKNPFTLDACDR